VNTHSSLTSNSGKKQKYRVVKDTKSWLEYSSPQQL